MTALGALILEFIFSIIDPSLISVDLINHLTYSLLIIVFIEEFSKYIVVKKISRHNQFSKNIFSTTLLMGLGFSIVEIIFNSFSQLTLALTLIIPYLGLLLIHTVTLGILGYYFSSKSHPILIFDFLIFLAIFLLHLLFNLAIFYQINYLLIFIVLSIILLSLFKKALINHFFFFLPTHNN